MPSESRVVICSNCKRSGRKCSPSHLIPCEKKLPQLKECELVNLISDEETPSADAHPKSKHPSLVTEFRHDQKQGLNSQHSHTNKKQNGSDGSKTINSPIYIEISEDEQPESTLHEKGSRQGNRKTVYSGTQSLPKRNDAAGSPPLLASAPMTLPFRAEGESVRNEETHLIQERDRFSDFSKTQTMGTVITTLPVTEKFNRGIKRTHTGKGKLDSVENVTGDIGPGVTNIHNKITGSSNSPSENCSLVSKDQQIQPNHMEDPENTSSNCEMRTVDDDIFTKQCREPDKPIVPLCLEEIDAVLTRLLEEACVNQECDNRVSPAEVACPARNKSQLISLETPHSFETNSRTRITRSWSHNQSEQNTN
ncbi:hypothetical protein M501DRAFT_598359 [Patellaria atrata CBS 101060]|uniref:Uncharacterized protein n=1 Tax=Patellaria atrata CBS 101060 TaxID=1346257 RepID=A0A9P4S3C2_9PEZI|nr:hypothetical protein M501DRAFT_598359 [Patellaria atrata CBS 101060]